MATSAVAAETERPANPTPAIIVLGADAVLAARPATAAQLTNACYAAGYNAVIPASWGDELVAAALLRGIAARGQGSVVLCSCPRVGERVRRVDSLRPHLLASLSPPAAAARYLRARAGQHAVHITYIGDCPGGSDPSIDRHATPASLLRSLSKHGIDILAQPAEVDERLVRDARRFYSLPGGAPAPNWLYVEKRGYTMIEPSSRDFLAEVAYRIANRERRVLDLAPRLGCSCSGVTVGEEWTNARARIAALEPRRAVHEVLDHDVPVDLGMRFEPWRGSSDKGVATTPITLEALAELYDPYSKASTYRTTPPPPVPRSRAPVEHTTASYESGGPAGQDVPTKAEAVSEASEQADDPNREPRAAGGGAVGGATADRDADDRPRRSSPKQGTIADVGEDEEWPGSEPALRTSGERGPLDISVYDRDARSGRRMAIVLLLLAIVAGVEIGLSAMLHRGPFARPSRPDSVQATSPISRPVPSDSVRTLRGPDDKAPPDSVRPDSAGDTAGALPRTSDLPRTPIGPDTGVMSTLSRRAPR